MSAEGPHIHVPLPQLLALSGYPEGAELGCAKTWLFREWRAGGESKEAKERGAGQQGHPAGTHCARSGPARSPPRHRHGCAGSSWWGRGGRRCTGASGGWPRPSRSARVAQRPRELGGHRLRPARGRPGPGRGPQSTGSAWHLSRARSAVPAAGLREAEQQPGRVAGLCVARWGVGRGPRANRALRMSCAAAPTARRLAAGGLI